MLPPSYSSFTTSSMTSRDFTFEVFGKYHHLNVSKQSAHNLIFIVNTFLLSLRDQRTTGLSLLSVINGKQPLELDVLFDKVPKHLKLIFFSRAATDVVCSFAILAKIMSFVPAAEYLRSIYSLMRTCKGAYGHLIKDAFWTDESIRFKNPFIGSLDEDWVAYRKAYGLPLMNLHRIRHIFNSTSRMKLYYGCLGEGSGECIAIVTASSSAKAILKLLSEQILPRSAKHLPYLATYEPLSDEGSLVKVEPNSVCVEDVAAHAGLRLRRVGDGRLAFYCWEHGDSAAQLLRVHCQRLYRRMRALVLVVACDEPNLPRLLKELIAAYFIEWRKVCLNSSSLQASSMVFSSLPMLVLLEVPPGCSGAEMLAMRTAVSDVVRPLAGKHALKVQPLRRGSAAPDHGVAAGFNFLARVLGRTAFL